MMSDEVINGKVFTALKYTLALVAMLAMGLQKRGFQDVVLLGLFQIIWAMEAGIDIQKLPGEST